MTLFPSLSDAYYVDNDSNLLKLMDYTYSKNVTINQSFWSEADTDSRFLAGDQTLWNDIYGNLPAFRRRQFNFNRMRRILNMITGYQRQHRKQTMASAVESADESTSAQFTKLLYHSNSFGHILETVSDAFEGALTTGMNLLSVWMDYRKDPINGDIAVDNLAYNSFLIDPYFKKSDLSDCNSIWVRKYLSRPQIKSLLPGREGDIDNLKSWGNRDGKFQFIPESYNYSMEDLVTYDEFWYLDTRRQQMLVDTQSGEVLEWKGAKEDLEDFLRLYPAVTTFNTEVQTVKLGISVQGRVLYHGANPLNIDSYPYVPVLAYYYPELPYFPWRIQGVLRGLRDAQYLYNRRRVIELDILESQIASGWKFKENALVNPKDVFLQGQGKGLALKAEAQMTDAEQIQPPQVPPSMIQLSELLGKEIQEISGVNEELLGSADDDKAGILSMLRQGAGLITLQKLFDNLDYAQRLLGNMQIRLIQNNWTPGKVKRILNEEPSPEFYNRLFSKYDAVVEESVNTSTQRQAQFMQLMQLKEMGVPVPTDLLIKNSNLQNKQELIEAIQKQEQQQQQMQQQAEQLNLAVLQAQIKDLEAKATANEGLGYERASRVSENQALAVERIAEAEKDRDLGVLDRIKAVKELATIDLTQLQQLIDIVEGLKGERQEEVVNKSKENTA